MRIRVHANMHAGGTTEPFDYDAELRRHHQALCRALEVRLCDRVLDIGCGAGQTTRDVALVASEGRVVGIDTAEHALRHARRRTLAAGLENVDYVCGDAAARRSTTARPTGLADRRPHREGPT